MKVMVVVIKVVVVMKSVGVEGGTGDHEGGYGDDGWVGDGWEREGEQRWYFEEFSLKRAYPMGINIVTYAMTH